MPVESIGVIHHIPETDVRKFLGARPVDRDFVVRLAKAHEDGDFDRVLTATASALPDGSHIAAYAAAHTERLSYLLSHRPGFRAPTVAARELATLDQLSEGRIAMHTITGAADVEMRRDGDHLSKEERYARTDEYLTILKQAWTATEPFDFQGRFYQIEGYMPAVRPFQQGSIPIYFGGSSEAAYRVGAKQADVYAIWSEPLAQTAEQIASIGAAARASGRAQPPRISVSLRVILGATEDLAWERAHEILERLAPTPAQGTSQPVAPSGRQPNFQKSVGTERFLAAAETGDRHDRALWTSIAKAVGGVGELPALVGTPETVAEALLDYYDVGATTFLIRGYDMYEDAVAFGRDVIPRVRGEVRRRDAQSSAGGSSERNDRVPTPT